MKSQSALQTDHCLPWPLILVIIGKFSYRSIWRNDCKPIRWFYTSINRDLKFVQFLSRYDTRHPHPHMFLLFSNRFNHSLNLISNFSNFYDSCLFTFLWKCFQYRSVFAAIFNLSKVTQERCKRLKEIVMAFGRERK